MAWCRKEISQFICSVSWTDGSIKEGGGVRMKYVLDELDKLIVDR